ncbi:hypothetical protein [Flavobacterium notoginsengisoli]|uniref:hypothetical protein n=1 Tax=Flavobacterium notoginsengisoli TaxID=1478199 RepID=UPI00362913DC
MHYLFLLTCGAALWSCTKEEDVYEDRKGEDVTEIITDQSKNKILSYKIINPGQKQAIYSAVDHDAKTITTYLPAYYQLEFMEVEIELPQGSTVSPAAKELVPVFSTQPIEYTVTGNDGTTAKYKLNVVLQYPDIVLNELSTATATRTIGISITVTGSNLMVSGAVTKLYLTDETGAKVWNYTLDEINSASMSLKFAAVNWNSDQYKTFSADKQKKYWLQLESYGITRRMTYPVTFQ